MFADFRQNLRYMLDYRDCTVKELSAKTGIPKSTLDSYLGIRASVPTADVAVKIAEALGVTVEYLVTGFEPKNHKTKLSETKKYDKILYNRTIRSLLDTLDTMNERDVETVHLLAQVVRKQAAKN